MSQLYLDANDAIKAEKQLQKIVSKYDNFLNIITSDFDKPNQLRVYNLTRCNKFQRIQ